MLATRLANVRPSMILGLVQQAQELAAQGRDIIDLGIGEPDFDTPDFIKQAACDAIAQGQTKYTVVPGTAEMRRAIANKLRQENHLDYPLDQITVSGGAKQIIYNAMMATLDPADEVIIPAPYWSSYPDIVALAEGTPVIVACPQSQRFLIAPEQLEAVISPRTKWLILNSPSNPAGSVYARQDLERLAAVLVQHPHVHILSDDIYEHLMFDGRRFTSILAVCPELKSRTLVVNGVSKAFAMTGWRLGYAAGPQDVIAAMNQIQSQSATHACSISQAAAVAGLMGPKDFIPERARCFEARRDVVTSRLASTPGLSCLVPEGAFYAYPNCGGVLGMQAPDGTKLNTDIDFCAWLLDAYGVSVVPGAAFGLSPHFRVSMAASDERLKEACHRIDAACRDLRP